MNQPPTGWSPQPPQPQSSQPQLPQAQLPQAQPPRPEPPTPPPPMGVPGAVRQGRGWVLPAAAGFGAALLVGGVLLATDVMSFGSGGGSISTSAISLPEQLAGLEDQGQFIASNTDDPDSAATQTSRYEKVRALTIAAYQRAYDGAGVDARSYFTDDAAIQVSVIAVRAPSPGLTNGVVADLEALGVEATPGQPELIVDGDVECFVMSTVPVPAGEKVDPDDLMTTTCQRTDDSLTVRTFGTGSGPEARALMIQTTNEAFDAVS